MRVTGAHRAIAGRSFRQVRRGAIAWGLAIGLTAAASAVTYADSFPTPASRAQLAATTAGDPSLAVLLGPIDEIGTVGGYTVYKGFVFLTTIAALWAIFATTRLLRGEEDAGRWQLVLAGSARPGDATAAALAALGAAIAVVTVLITVIVAAAGRDPAVAISPIGAVRYAASIALVAAVFVGVGAVASQLARTRRAANGLSALVFAAALLVRMVADSDPRLHWLRWLSPFGWSERMRPLTAPSSIPLLPAAAMTGALIAASIALAARRDVGAGLLARAEHGRFRPRGLGSTWTFALRQERNVLIGWILGATATGVFLGTLAQITTRAVPASMQTTLDKLGIQGGLTRQYVSVSFLLVATILALLPASQIAAAADEELSGRLPHLLAQPVGRDRWLAGRLVVAALAIALAGLVAGLATWAGATARGVDLSLATLVAAGLNTVPTALLVLGIGALVLVFAPRAASTVVYALVIWSLVVDIVAPLLTSAGWLADLSVFQPMALAPAEPIDAATTTAVLALALVGGALACVLFHRRDLRTA